MARWTDLARRQEHTTNQGGAATECRGVVIHTAEGSYEGTIAWQRNPSANVSSHFIVSKTGTICQMVDTDTVAWTQRAGNGHWLSVENEGFGGSKHEPLTDAQCQAIAQILARAHQVYGVPLQLATSATGRGLGHHSMGGTAWGHLDCPGPQIIAQKAAIVARAKQLLTPTGDDMLKDEAIPLTSSTGHPALRDGATALGDVFAHVTGGELWPQSPLAKIGPMAADVAALRATAQTGGVDLDALAAKVAALVPKPPTAAEVAALVPKPPTAAEVAVELAKRLGNG